MFFVRYFLFVLCGLYASNYDNLAETPPTNWSYEGYSPVNALAKGDGYWQFNAYELDVSAPQTRQARRLEAGTGDSVFWTKPKICCVACCIGVPLSLLLAGAFGGLMYALIAPGLGGGVSLISS